MKKYVAFLRAINVGGSTVIKMDQLKGAFESFGLSNVHTYIQTGNVIFESEDEHASVLERQIEHQLEKMMGNRIQLFVRTMREIKFIAEKPPYELQNGETLHVVFLRQAPIKKSAAALLAFKSEADDFIVRGSEAFNLRRDRNNSVFSNNFVEKVLGVSGTTRNLTTIRKIVEKYG